MAKVSPAIRLRACYAKSGTEVPCGDTSTLETVPTATQVNPYAMFSTGIAYGGSATCLRIPYGMSGADLGYAATRLSRVPGDPQS
eukprot:2718971-Rhodomonas_salina.3